MGIDEPSLRDCIKQHQSAIRRPCIEHTLSRQHHATVTSTMVS